MSRVVVWFVTWLCFAYYQSNAASCPDALRRGNTCFSFHSEAKNWTAARDSCRLDGGDLVEVVNEDVQTFVRKKLQVLRWPRAWLGGSRLTTPWRWIANSEQVGRYKTIGCFQFEYQIWQTEFFDGNSSFPCTKKYLTPDFCVMRCSARGMRFAAIRDSYVCYCRNAISDIRLLPVAKENCQSSCCGNPSLTCGGEGRITVFDLKDTFSRWLVGYPNGYLTGRQTCGGVMVKRGKVGWNDFHCRQEKKFICQYHGEPCSSPRNLTLAGSCFSFSHVTATWFLARKACRDSGGDLATLSNNFTSSAVGQFLLNGRGCRDCSWWIGLTNARWVWPSGTCGSGVEYNNWAPGWPVDKYEGCMAVCQTPQDAVWANMKCDQQYQYICEKDIELPGEGQGRSSSRGHSSSYRVASSQTTTRRSATDIEFMPIPFPIEPSRIEPTIQPTTSSATPESEIEFVAIPFPIPMSSFQRASTVTPALTSSIIPAQSEITPSDMSIVGSGVAFKATDEINPSTSSGFTTKSTVEYDGSGEIYDSNEEMISVRIQTSSTVEDQKTELAYVPTHVTDDVNRRTDEHLIASPTVTTARQHQIATPRMAVPESETSTPKTGYGVTPESSKNTPIHATGVVIAVHPTEEVEPSVSVSENQLWYIIGILGDIALAVILVAVVVLLYRQCTKNKRRGPDKVVVPAEGPNNISMCVNLANENGASPPRNDA